MLAVNVFHGMKAEKASYGLNVIISQGKVRQSERMFPLGKVKTLKKRNA
jgi:hypothetical protein